ncbi:hypothetical protein ZORO111902_15335 [Zobellia roscoffensis]
MMKIAVCVRDSSAKPGFAFLQTVLVTDSPARFLEGTPLLRFKG